MEEMGAETRERAEDLEAGYQEAQAAPRMEAITESGESGRLPRGGVLGRWQGVLDWGVRHQSTEDIPDRGRGTQGGGIESP